MVGLGRAVSRQRLTGRRMPFSTLVLFRPGPVNHRPGQGAPGSQTSEQACWTHHWSPHPAWSLAPRWALSKCFLNELRKKLAV